MPSPPRRTAAPRPRPTAGDRRSAIDAAGFPRRGPVPPSRLTRGASAHPKESGCSITSPTRTTTRQHHRRPSQTPDGAPAPRRRRRAATRQAGPPVISPDPEPTDAGGAAAPVMSAQSTPVTDQDSTDRSGDAESPAAAESGPAFRRAGDRTAGQEDRPEACHQGGRRRRPADPAQARDQEGDGGGEPSGRAGRHVRSGRRSAGSPGADRGGPGRDPYRSHRRAAPDRADGPPVHRTGRRPDRRGGVRRCRCVGGRHPDRRRPRNGDRAARGRRDARPAGRGAHPRRRCGR